MQTNTIKKLTITILASLLVIVPVSILALQNVTTKVVKAFPSLYEECTYPEYAKSDKRCAFVNPPYFNQNICRVRYYDVYTEYSKSEPDCATPNSPYSDLGNCKTRYYDVNTGSYSSCSPTSFTKVDNSPCETSQSGCAYTDYIREPNIHIDFNVPAPKLDYVPSTYYQYPPQDLAYYQETTEQNFDDIALIQTEDNPETIYDSQEFLFSDNINL